MSFIEKSGSIFIAAPNTDRQTVSLRGLVPTDRIADFLGSTLLAIPSSENLEALDAGWNEILAIISNGGVITDNGLYFKSLEDAPVIPHAAVKLPAGFDRNLGYVKTHGGSAVLISQIDQNFYSMDIVARFLSKFVDNQYSNYNIPSRNRVSSEQATIQLLCEVADIWGIGETDSSNRSISQPYPRFRLNSPVRNLY